MQLTPDGAQAILCTGSALYRLPLASGQPIRLARLTHAGGAWPCLAATNERAVYQDGDAIYSIALAGGAPSRLSAPPRSGASIAFERLSLDGRWVIYTVEQTANHTIAIYGAPIAGGAPALLQTGDRNTTWIISISGDYAIGVASGTLYAAPLRGGPRLQLSHGRFIDAFIFHSCPLGRPFLILNIPFRRTAATFGMTHRMI